MNYSIPHKAGQRYNWDNLYGCSMGYVISQAVKQATGPVLVLTTDSLAAQRLEDELHFFKENDDVPILQFPAWETLPYDLFSPHQDIVSARLSTLYKLPSLKRGVLIVPIFSLMQRLLPQQYLAQNSFLIDKGDKFDIASTRLRLEASGYHNVSQVIEHGEYTLRGSILDLYPMGSELPFRIDLFDEEVDSIRTFDPDTQRTIGQVDHIHLLPAREFPLTETAITHFRQSWRSRFIGNPSNCPIYQNVSRGIAAPGLEYYLPLFFEQTQTLFEYLPNSSLLIKVGNLPQAATSYWQEINQRHEQQRYDTSRPILEPHELFLRVEELFACINQFPQIQVQQENINKIDPAVAQPTSEPTEITKSEIKLSKVNFPSHPIPDLKVDRKAKQPLMRLDEFLTMRLKQQTARTLFCVETAGRREALLELLKNLKLQPQWFNNWHDYLLDDTALGITIGDLQDGMLLDDPNICIITETQLFGQQVLQQRRRKERQFDIESSIRDLIELNIGAPIVHIDHGIGRYLGLQTLTIANQEAEYLMLEYAGGDKVYVPVASLHLISRYSGPDSDHISLTKLGSDQWSKAKRKAAEQIRDVAAELLEIYAKREVKKGFCFSLDETDYINFSSAFKFEETPDQHKAINSVIADMQTEKAMDHLVCGDVGFGKTEVAMRAAFLAVENHKQVAVLVPTTLLAQQHFTNFKDRFADWPVNIEALSRFRSAKEQKAILDKLAEGKVDIIIGTHKLIQKDIKFQNLGLVIIDEEHRFGVQQKDRLKTLRHEVDILALTATPIPRTLHMAMAGIRDLSIIATPPARRLAIKTFIQERNKPLIREAILRESLRGGQVYFLHNEVQSINRTAQELQELLPEIKIDIAHGQMHERELERVMSDFYHHRFHVLVCSTIIESGIDIPTANTIIIDRADKFGLAQLHQLRGRVGRSHHQAYAYLMIPPEKTLTTDAKKRLDALISIEDLGAGFMLATHDLEIRGAGELLGEQQSGHMQAIGFNLYMELLERAVADLKAGKEPELEKPLHQGSEIELAIPALLPEIYVADVHTRLVFYKRIANAKNNTELDELQVELIDRFGLLPPAAKNLFAITELKLKAQALGIRKIEANSKGGTILFDDKPAIEPMKLINLVKSQPQQYRFEGSQKLRFSFKPDQVTDLFQALEDTFVQLV
ncbi:transcription-repair coupling factor [soil metagenome]